MSNKKVKSSDIDYLLTEKEILKLLEKFKLNPMKSYICKNCEGIYWEKVSQCDCLPDKNEFYVCYSIKTSEVEEYTK